MRLYVFCQRFLVIVLSSAVTLSIFVFSPPGFGQQTPPPSSSEQAPESDQPRPSELSPDQLQQLVAPIALYPDSLVAQILAASAYPTQIVEAQRFLEQNPDLKGKDLADAVDKQDWDPSVKALTQFPSVLSNMDKDLSWTSELGDANTNQQADVMNAIQDMRQKAQQAGTLKSTQQQTVSAEDNQIQIQPANPEVVYVPQYNPALVYGYPVPLWPGFYPWWYAPGPYISFGAGFAVAPFFGFGWGWPHWGFDWHHRGLLYAGRPYVWRSPAFYDRRAYFRGGGLAPRPGFSGYARGNPRFRGYGGVRGRGVAPPARAPGRFGAFGGVSRGGETRGFESRGRSSFGGGGRTGGGARGGGGGRGGRH